MINLPKIHYLTLSDLETLFELRKKGEENVNVKLSIGDVYVSSITTDYNPRHEKLMAQIDVTVVYRHEGGMFDYILKFPLTHSFNGQGYQLDLKKICLSDLHAVPILDTSLYSKLLDFMRVMDNVKDLVEANTVKEDEKNCIKCARQGYVGICNVCEDYDKFLAK